MSTPAVVPKLCGADVELGNFVTGDYEFDDSVRAASQALLAEVTAEAGIRGSAPSPGRQSFVDPQDRERAFLRTTGGSAYIDLDHLEICLPEVLSAYDSVACWQAMLGVVQAAQERINARRGDVGKLQVLVNNSDGRGHSYGNHLNFLISRGAWDNLVHRKPHYLAYLVAFQVSSLPISGQGKVGSENGAPQVEYQLSQRADFFETISGIQTTSCRPLVNTRDEPHCGRHYGGSGDLARAHVIFFDSTLCPVSRLLTVGTMQVVLAMIEAGVVDAELALDDPLEALRRWSHDPTLEAGALLVGGESVSALGLQRRFLEAALRCLDDGVLETVPRAAEILALWEDTLTRLDARDWEGLSGRLDWVLKRSLLERAQRGRPGLSWDSPEIKYLDHLYSSLDRSEGLFWNFAERGLIESVVPEAVVQRFRTEPPSDTRAWGRAMLLRQARPEWIVRLDWDVIRLRIPDEAGEPVTWRVDLPDPLGATRAQLESALTGGHSIEELLRIFGATRERTAEIPWSKGAWYPASWWPIEVSGWSGHGYDHTEGGRYGDS